MSKKKRFNGPAGRVVPIQKDNAVVNDKDALLMTPANVGDVVKISKAVAEDVCENMTKSTFGGLSDLAIGQTIHINSLQKLLVDRGIFTMDEYLETLKSCTEEFNRQRKEAIDKMDEVTTDVEGIGSEESVEKVSEGVSEGNL